MQTQNIYDCSPNFAHFADKFTGKERDSESGLDYFGARYYASSMGRFSSPDPSGLYYADPTNPQSLNLYAYALNNPLKWIDPNGLTACFYGGAGDTTENDDDASDYETVGSEQECSDNGGVSLDATTTVNVTASSSGSADTTNAVGTTYLTGVGQPNLLVDQWNTSSKSSAKQWACTADAVVNFGLGFIPGYNVLKLGITATGGNLNFFQNAQAGKSIVTFGPTPFQGLAAAGSGYSLYADARYAAAGGASQLERLTELAGRSGFGLKSAASQAKTLGKLGNLTNLAEAASTAGTVANVLNAVSATYDVYSCWNP